MVLLAEGVKVNIELKMFCTQIKYFLHKITIYQAESVVLEVYSNLFTQINPKKYQIIRKIVDPTELMDEMEESAEHLNCMLRLMSSGGIGFGTGMSLVLFSRLIIRFTSNVIRLT